MNRINKILLSLSAISLIAATLFTLSLTDFQFYPDQENVTLSPYTDTVGSEISAFISTEKGFTFRAAIGSKSPYPYAGIRFKPADTLINVAKYETVEIRTLPNCDDFNVTALVYEEGVSSEEKVNSYRYLQMETTVNPLGDTIEMVMRDMPTPAWWYSMNDIKRETCGEADFTKFTGIALSIHPATKPGDTVTIAIDSVILKPNRRIAFVAAGIFSLIMLLTGVIIKVKEPTIRHVPIEPQSIELEPRTQSVLGTIAKRYSENSFTIERCSDICGLSPYHIRKIIQKEHNCSFSIYLRLVRILEAERLLRESECDIKEISHRVGFSHPSSFNRAFKEKTGNSPSGFREMISKTVVEAEEEKLAAL